MKLVRNISSLRKKIRKPVLAIGTFDGVHLGHQKIIKQVVREARLSKGTSIVLTFTPHPLKILKHIQASPSITSLKHRIDLIKYLGVDLCLLLDFNQRLSRIPARKFVKHILVDALNIDCLIVGKGFCFGRNKKGTFSVLKELSKIYGFKLLMINPIKKQGQIISSSRIRRLIQIGKISQANKLLGRCFSLYGKVKKGKARGRILGYPTANIKPEQEVVPLSGVYAALVRLDKQILSGIVNIGTRPTFRPEKESASTIEIHIFNFHRKIYGRKLEIFFIQRLRAEKKFTSHQALLKRIRIDEQRARKILHSKCSCCPTP